MSSPTFSKTFAILRNALPWNSKKIVHVRFCVFQTKVNKAANIFCRLPEWIRNVQMIPGSSTRLEWERGWKSFIDETQKTEDPKSNKGNLNFPTHTVNVIELIVGPTHSPFLREHPPSLLFRFIPLFWQKKFVLPLRRDSIFGKSYPPYNKRGKCWRGGEGVGGGLTVQLWFLMVVIDISVNYIFHATAPTIKTLTEVLYTWIKAFLVGFISVVPVYWFWIFY